MSNYKTKNKNTFQRLPVCSVIWHSTVTSFEKSIQFFPLCNSVRLANNNGRILYIV